MTTAPTQAITITLPGPPVAYAVEPARLVAWLVGRGWIECVEPGYLSKRGQDPIWIPLDAGQTDLREAVVKAADAEGLRPCALAALLSTPEEGPALQWAHASAAGRERILALLDGPALDQRKLAAWSRKTGLTEAALEAEGRAMEYEAAAAVLRGGQRG